MNMQIKNAKMNLHINAKVAIYKIDENGEAKQIILLDKTKT